MGGDKEWARMTRSSFSSVFLGSSELQQELETVGSFSCILCQTEREGVRKGERMEGRREEWREMEGWGGKGIRREGEGTGERMMGRRSRNERNKTDTEEREECVWWTSGSRDSL